MILYGNGDWLVLATICLIMIVGEAEEIVQNDTKFSELGTTVTNKSFLFAHETKEVQNVVDVSAKAALADSSHLHVAKPPLAELPIQKPKEQKTPMVTTEAQPQYQNQSPQKSEKSSESLVPSKIVGKEMESINTDDLNIVQARLSQAFLKNNINMQDTYKAGFYFFVGISSIAILFIVFRIYRLRLSRAERKYGVQGDRANQELTPLPMAIEDINSDEEDHTVFEVNCKNIRIL